jgi:hypothetical protein
MPSWRGTRDATLGDADRLKKLKEIANLLEEPWKSELLWIPEGTPVADNAVSYWITIPWDNADGSITLAGDAAHPLPPRKLSSRFIPKSQTMLTQTRSRTRT